MFKGKSIRRVVELPDPSATTDHYLLLYIHTDENGGTDTVKLYRTVSTLSYASWERECVLGGDGRRVILPSDADQAAIEELARRELPDPNATARREVTVSFTRRRASGDVRYRMVFKRVARESKLYSWRDKLGKVW